NFGFKVNSEVFLRLAQNLPLKVIQKHSNNLLQIEALLFGQAGLLEEAEEDEYVRLLKREYSFLSHKYDLQNSLIKASAWKFSKLRPNNFPTLRIAQWAAWLQQTPQLFSTIFEWSSPEKVQKQFQIKTSSYWQNHYIFGKETEKKVPAFGKSSTENILMNSLVPLLVAYAEAQDNKIYTEKAVLMLEKLPAEDNFITRIWESLGLKTKNAFDSQASIELYNHFCTQKRCLSCKIGTAILTSGR
ncbi:MAG: DUF2851 family protein, partial [Verrucomicrobia bacterium]|nr:DUF2851 family protein [Cytophagales bacterium]